MASLVARFRDDPRLLAQALSEQSLFADAKPLVVEILPLVTVQELPLGQTLITQGAADNDLYFILAGELSIVVNGRPLARRQPKEHVGEMSMIDPSATRSASVIAIAESVIAKISETDFSRIAARNPDLWRLMAVTLTNRLRQRNNLVIERRERPVLFIGFSSEALPIATALAECLGSEPFEVRLWTDSVFEPSKVNIEALEAQIRLSDFAVLVLTPDDKLTSRGTDYPSPRDNIVFELGLFMGSVGRNRTFLLRARGANLKIPSDLHGIVPLEYDPDNAKPLSDRVASAADGLRRIIAKLGPL